MLQGTVRDIQNVLVWAMLLFALTLVSVFMLADAAAAWLALHLSASAAGAIVGAAALAPLVVVLIVMLFRSAARRTRAASESSAFMQSADLPASVRDLVDTVQRLTRTAPIAAIALALVAGIVLTRYPASLPLIISAFSAQQRPT